MRSMTWALTGLLAIVLSFCEVSPCAADDQVSPKDPAPSPAEQLAINADEVASGAGVSFSPDDGATSLNPVQGSFVESLRAILEDEALILAQLNEEIAAATDLETRVALERRMADRKQQTEIEILQLHLVRAQAEGRNEDATRIEVGLKQLLEPTPIVPTTEKRIRASR